MKITDREAIADEGKVIRRKGTEPYFLRTILNEGETKADFEEITISEYKEIQKVNEYNKLNNYDDEFINDVNNKDDKNLSLSLNKKIN